MSPANKPGSGGFGRIHPGVRNLIVVCVAVLTGTIVGGDELEPGLSAVGAPIRDRGGALRGGIGRGAA